MAMPCSGAPDRPSTLLDLTSAPDYFGRVSEVVQRIPYAQSEAEAVELLSDAAHRIGADVAAFVSFLRDDGTYESFRFLLACDAVWCHEYERQAWYANDPWLVYALNHSEPVIASELQVGSAQKAIVDLAVSFGFRSTVVVPAPSAGGLTRVGVLCLGSGTPGYFEAGGFVAVKIASRGLAMELHEWWIGRFKHEVMANARITDDDLVLLRHERLGHATKVIASALDTTASSIDSRFQRVNQKLGVPNRKAAATLAAEYGLI
jgi:DNA-binding CsgD family transcriptional regulator